MKFDLGKYGFEKTRDRDGFKTWNKKLDNSMCEFYVEVFDTNGNITIDTIANGIAFTHASRYLCENYDQLEYLLFKNSRFGDALHSSIKGHEAQ